MTSVRFIQVALVLACFFSVSGLADEADARRAIYAAIQARDVPRAKALLVTKKSRTERIFAGDTALHLAAQENLLELVTYLLDKGVDANIRSGFQNIPLHSGAAHEKVVGLLLARGANIRTTNDWGKTPLHYATGAGNPHSVEAILAAGADVNALMNTGDTPAHVLVDNVSCENPVPVLKILAKYKADFSLKDALHGRTVLELATHRGNQPAIDFLTKDRKRSR